MAASFATSVSNDRQGNKRDLFTATIFQDGTLNGAKEGIIGLPASGVDGATAGNGWELVDVVLHVGVNTTHTTSTPLINVTVEKNTDGGTTALATAPSIDNTAGTGRKHTGVTATGIIKGVVHGTAANRQFADYDTAFVTILEAGASGTDPSDVSATLVFSRIQNFDPAA